MSLPVYFLSVHVMLWTCSGIGRTNYVCLVTTGTLSTAEFTDCHADLNSSTILDDPCCKAPTEML